MSKSKIKFGSKSSSSIICTDDVNHTLNTSSFSSDDIIDASSLEVLDGHEVTLVNKSMYIEEIVVTDGRMDFAHYPYCTNLSNNQIIITIGSKGKLSLTGHELPIKEVTIHSGGQLRFVLENYQYQLNANDDIQFNSNCLKQLVQTTNFMYDRFANKENIIIDHNNTAGLKKYKKLCEIFGKDTVQNFIKTKEPLITFDYISKNLEKPDLMKNSLLSSFIKKHSLSTKQTIDFKAIDKVIAQFINDHYFELTGIAKKPLEKGFEEKFGNANEILKNISSFLNLNDIINHSPPSPEENIETSGDLTTSSTNYYE